MFRNKSVSTHQFAMVPKADIPRSSFRMQKAVKTTFDAGLIVPVMVEEVLPGDTFHASMTAFCRLATPIFPFMDNMKLDSHFFFVPNRLVWENWQKFMGEQDNPGDSTDYLIPVCESPASGYAVGSIFDQMGLPTVGQIAGGETFEHSALPLRAYNLIYNEWFRDENLQDSVDITRDDGPDNYTAYTLLRRGKRHDYFTSCLPFVQKGPSVPLPIYNGTLPVTGNGNAPTFDIAGSVNPADLNLGIGAVNGTGHMQTISVPATSGQLTWNAANLFVDLNPAAVATINQVRQSFQIQKLLERDARGGTRYTEIVRSHFGVVSPDARLQRPEYLGGGTTSISINPIAQTSASTVSGSDTPIATLSAFGTALAQGHGFSQSFVEHGYVIGVISVRADLTYQQGLRRHWSRQTKFDFYFPVFAALGEQAVLQKEIYCRGTVADEDVFGYQERWADYRYSPSEIKGLMRSTAAGTLDAWHLSQHFTSPPALNGSFIEEHPPIDRVVAVTDQPHFLGDFFFDIKAARPMPMYSVPGLVDHF